MPNKQSVNDIAASLLFEWRQDPKLFCETALDITLDEQQLEMLDIASVSGCRLAIKSCRGAGKTFLLAVLTLWFLLCFEDVTVRIYSPSHKQLTDVFQREMRKLHQRLDPVFQEMLEIQTERTVHIGDRTNAASVVTANASTLESLSGVHSETQVSFFDEGSAIDDAVYSTVLGSMGTAVNGGYAVITSNPTRSGGFYGDLFEKKPDRWKLLTFDAMRSAHISEDFIQEMADLYGEDSDEYRVSILGLFPRASSTQFIPASLVEDAVKRYLDRRDYESDPIVMGIDVARSHSSDKSVIILRQGRKVLDILAFQTADTMEVVTKARDLFYERSASHIYLDATGVGGPVGDRLRQLHLPVSDVMVGSPSTDKTQYFNLRAQLWGEMRSFLETGDIPDHFELRKELCNMRWGYSAKMAIQLIAKRAMRNKDLGGSPDHADALSMTFFDSTLSIRKRGLAGKRKIRKSNRLWV